MPVKFLGGGRYIVVGEVSKATYDFSSPGAVVEVNSWDVPALLRKERVLGGCCGSPPQPTPLFELA